MICVPAAEGGAIARGALMHGLQEAEAQGPTLERGPLAAGKLIFSNNYLYGSLQK